MGVVDLCYDDDGNWDGLWEGCLKGDFRCSSLTVLLWYLSIYRGIIVIFFSQLEWNDAVVVDSAGHFREALVCGKFRMHVSLTFKSLEKWTLERMTGTPWTEA